MIVPPTTKLTEFMAAGPYVAYSYSYPHKTAYRPFATPLSIRSLWQEEPQESLFAYVHIPFCEFRCGFCNLFTLSQPDEDVPTEYLKMLRRQARTIRNQLPNAMFSRLAIGGGTPTFLSSHQLDHLFSTLHDDLGIDGQSVPISFEVSPGTIDREKLRQLHDFGVERVSMGVQSLDFRDTASLGRPQKASDVYRAIDLLRDRSFPKLNLDLIYGAADQTLATWSDSVKQVVELRPDEIYLYPLYVRPLTGLANISKFASDARLAMYRAGRDWLLQEGYEQISMRMFQLAKTERQQSVSQSMAPDYICQRDGMIGFGCGARSYTQSYHYGSNYAVKQKSILHLIQQYVRQSDDDLSQAVHGIELDADDRRRRFLILSLLMSEGLHVLEYENMFGTAPLDDYPELHELLELEMATLVEENFRLTSRGLEWSDTIGPWLYSERVRRRTREFPWND